MGMLRDNIEQPSLSLKALVMITLSRENEGLLVAALKEGRIVLILGAGASATSRNRLEKNVLQAMGLAETLAKEAGLA
jgi:hypothetical protein